MIGLLLLGELMKCGHRVNKMAITGKRRCAIMRAREDADSR